MKILLALISILISTQALANNSAKVAISNNTDVMMHSENLNNIVTISEKIKEAKTSVDPYEKCIKKGLIYLGTGATNSDADNCYDVANSTNPNTNYRPILAGYLSYNAGATNTFSFLSGNSFFRSDLDGRFAADIECDKQFNDSRALTYDDLKYVMPTLSNATNISNSPVWVYDSIEDNKGTNSALSKFGDVVSNLNDCNSWGTSNTSAKAMILKKQSADNHLTVDYATCATPAYIACIYN